MKNYRTASLIGIIVLAGLLIFLFFFWGDGNDNLAGPTIQAVASPAAPVQTPTLPTPTFTTAAAVSISTPIPTPLPPTATAIPPTSTPTSTPTATAIPPTLTLIAISIPPTPTLPPPTKAISSTPTLTPVPATTAPTATPLPPTATTTATSFPATVTPVPTGQFTLLKPLLKDGCYGNPPINFEWQWTDLFDPARQGFEIRVWRDGEPPLGAHDAVLDNKNGQVKALGQNTYSLEINISGAAGVKGRSGEYWWTVSLVEIEPAYQPLNIQATPEHLCFAVSGGDSGGDGGGGGGGGSGGPINP